jgi:hypothetical protein
MPVYNEETFNYEILLRFGDSGPNKGKLTGASRTTITQTTKDGVPIGGGTNINPPEQLALIAGQEGEMLADVLGEVNAQTIITNQVLTSANQSLSANIDELLANIQSLDSDLTEVRVELTTAQASLAGAQAEIQRLKDQLAAQSAAAADASTSQSVEIQRLTALVNEQSPAAEPVTEAPAE